MRNMLRLTVFPQMLVWTLVGMTLMGALCPPESRAMLAPPSATAGEPGTRAADLQKVQSVLETKVVGQRLADYGLSQEEISARLDRLSDAQLHQLATQIDAMIPAGDGGLGIVIALLVIAILAVILIYLLDHKITVTK